MTNSGRQHWNPDQYAEHARFVSELGMPVVKLLSPQPGERILDLGCGDGVLAVKLGQMGCQVVGIDASAEMIAAAQGQGVQALVMDGQALEFDGQFDAVFSNAALHWMKNPRSVIDGVWRALTPGGRFVGEFGGQGNVATITQSIQRQLSYHGLDLEDPWYFPSPEAYRRLLEEQGFLLETLALIPRLTPLPGDLGDWLKTFAGPYLSPLSAEEQRQVIAAVVDELRPTRCEDGRQWTADYVRLRFSASKPAERFPTNS